MKRFFLDKADLNCEFQASYLSKPPKFLHYF
jgi:hypothetical protein